MILTCVSVFVLSNAPVTFECDFYIGRTKARVQVIAEDVAPLGRHGSIWKCGESERYTCDPIERLPIYCEGPFEVDDAGIVTVYAKACENAIGEPL